jgi:hypothetical protein
MKRRFPLLVLVVAFAFVSASCDFMKVYDIRGSWRVEIGSDSFEVECSGAKESGTISTLEGILGIGISGYYSVDGKDVVLFFAYQIVYPGADKEEYTLDGQFTASSEMSGTGAKVVNGGSPVSIIWTAKSI